MITIEELSEIRIGDYVEVCKRKFDPYTQKIYYEVGKLYRILDVIPMKDNTIHIETESEQGHNIITFFISIPIYFYDDYVFHAIRKNRMDKIKTIL